MTTSSPRLYDDLAWLWPLWGDPEGDYATWCGHVVRLLQEHAAGPLGTLLNIGCGGGKNAYNLKANFAVTGLDLSPAMLELARTRNPDCEFILCDMRSFDLGRQFDCVLMDDAISYMTTREDLAAAFRRAFAHLRPGGAMIVSPDRTAETFAQNRTRVSHAESEAKPSTLDVVFIENDFDPDPGDEQFEATMVYLIREDGRLRVELDRHVLGLFPLAVWRAILGTAGFHIHEEPPLMPASPEPVFACVRPE